MPDEVVGWGEETVPPQQDVVPSEATSEPESDRESIRRRSRGRIAIAVLAAGLIVGAVSPVLLCMRGWHSAQTVRGFGAGRGVFTVVSCGDRQTDNDDDVTYTCTGTFAREGASAVGVSRASRVYSESTDSSYGAGAAIPARVTGDSDVSLGDDSEAGARMGFWLTLAVVVVFAEASIVRALRLRILGRPQKWELGGPFMSVAAVLFLGVMFFILATAASVGLFSV